MTSTDLGKTQRSSAQYGALPLRWHEPLGLNFYLSKPFFNPFALPHQLLVLYPSYADDLDIVREEIGESGARGRA